MVAPPTSVAKRLTRAAGSASTVAHVLLQQRDPGVARRLTPRERRVEAAMATPFTLTAGALMLTLLANARTRTPRCPWSPPTRSWPAFASRSGQGWCDRRSSSSSRCCSCCRAAVARAGGGGVVLSELPEIARDAPIPSGPWSRWPILACHRPGDRRRAARPWTPRAGPLGLCVLALLSQFSVDFAASTLREFFGAGISPRQLAPVLAIVYVVDALLAPIGFLAVLASRDNPLAYLFAVAPGALLALIARERRNRIEFDLALGRAYRRSTRALDEQAEDLRRQAGRLKRFDRACNTVSVPDRGARAAAADDAIEAVQADCGRRSTRAHDGSALERVALGRPGGPPTPCEAPRPRSPGAVPSQVTIGDTVGPRHPARGAPSRPRCLTVGRFGRPFSPAERELLEHLAAQAAVSLENVRLQHLMAKTQEELRMILEGVADAVTAEDAAAARLRQCRGDPMLGPRRREPPDIRRS